MSIQDDIWDLESVYAGMGPGDVEYLVGPGNREERFTKAQVGAEIDRLKAKQAAHQPAPKGRSASLVKAAHSRRVASGGAARGSAYCRLCNGPHVYKHGRP